MTDFTQPERHRPRWGRWFVGALGLLLIVGLFRMLYPAYRTRQLVGQLRQIGYQVETLPIFGHWWLDWTGGYGKDMFCRDVRIFSLSVGKCQLFGHTP